VPGLLGAAEALAALPFCLSGFAADLFAACGLRFTTSSRSTSASTLFLSTTTETHLPSWNVVAFA
jgi:hypothetical protein